MITQRTFSAYYAILAEEFGEQMSDARLMMHYKLLSDVDATDEQFIRAVESILKERKFNKMPKIAEILEAIHGSLDDRTEQAWAVMIDALSRHGAYRSPEFEDAAIAHAIESVGGWQYLCRQNIDEFKFLRKSWESAYRSFAKKPDLQPMALIGITEQANGAAGYEIDSRVRIECEYLLPHQRYTAIEHRPNDVMAAVESLAAAKNAL